MVKIMLTVRNRLAITKKCIEAIQRHSQLPYQLYVYDNQTNYLIDEHFEYFRDLYKNGDVTQVTFNTDQSTFNAFSKASACNAFGLNHEQDPKKYKYTFLLMLDNDIIVTPGWDTRLKGAWKYVNKNKLKNIHVIGQMPGGIKQKEKILHRIGDIDARAGRLGGSGLWSVRPTFFRDVGYLPIDQLVNHNKKHDQLYWRKLSAVSGGQAYILGLGTKLGVHCGKSAGSVCNRLTRAKNNPKRLELIKFVEAEKNINSLSFDDFYNSVVKDKILSNDW